MEKVTPGFFILLICFASAFSSQDTSIIIIGAGPAGIAAATRLLENNFHNIKILEAESRIGGRIHSVKFGDAFVDLGAQWCHGQTDNIVYELVKDLNILKPSSASAEMYHSSKKLVDEEFADELFSIMESVYSADGDRDDSEYSTVGDYCIKYYNASVYEKFGHDRRKFDLAMSAVDYFQHEVLSYEGSFSWFEPASKNDYRDCDGDLHLNWDGLGYKTILEVLMRKYPDSQLQLPIDDKILLNKEVVSIRWNENTHKEGVTILCSDRSSYTADHIIFTPSIGVLKERSSDMFIPKLPHSKSEAIKNIGFGAVMKVFLHYPNPWWKNSTGFTFVWSEEDKRAVLWEFPEGPSWNGRSWVTELYALVTVEGNPNALVAWFSGKLIPAIELLPEKTLISGIDYILNKFLDHRYAITKPDSIIRSQWYSNPHFRGVYSFQTVRSKRGNKVASEDDLAMPIKNSEGRPIIQFAGEATHPHYFSTVHGAIETGHREADVLVNLYL